MEKIQTADMNVSAVEASKSVESIVAESQEFIAKKIKNDEDLKQATELLSRVKNEAKSVKSILDGIVKPMKESMDAAKSLFKQPQERLSDMEIKIKQSILDYNRKVQAAAAKKAEKIEEKVNAGTIEFGTAMAKMSNIKQAPSSMQTETGGFQVRQGPLKIRVTDPSKLPASYFLRPRVIEAIRLEISEDVRAGQQVPEGAESYRDTIVAATA